MKKYLILVSIVLVAIKLLSQVTLLYEDFENTAEFLANWTVVNGGQTNQWHVGTATAYNSTRSIYVSYDGGISNYYVTNQASVVHFYKDIYFPPGNLHRNR
jgi:hypothetical protein